MPIEIVLLPLYSIRVVHYQGLALTSIMQGNTGWDDSSTQYFSATSVDAKPIHNNHAD